MPQWGLDESRDDFLACVRQAREALDIAENVATRASCPPQAVRSALRTAHCLIATARTTVDMDQRFIASNWED